VTTINVNAIESSTSTLTIGESGNSVVAADSVNVNLVKDASGATMWQSNGSGVLSNVNSKFGDSLVLLSTQSASSSASIEFTSGIDATYKEYVFQALDVIPATDETRLQFETSTDGGSTWGVTKTSATFRAEHDVAGSTTELAYWIGIAEATTAVTLTDFLGNVAPESGMATVKLFNPASTTYVKNFYVETQSWTAGAGRNRSNNLFGGGYLNTTSAINALRFKISSGNIAYGKFKMYGVK